MQWWIGGSGVGSGRVWGGHQEQSTWRPRSLVSQCVGLGDSGRGWGSLPARKDREWYSPTQDRVLLLATEQIRILDLSEMF